MLYLSAGLDLYTGLLLLFVLTFVLFYEATNGFCNAASTVITVTYTRAMHSQSVVVMATLLNFSGVLLGDLNVAYTIVHMSPTNLLLSMGSSHSLTMVLSTLLAATI